MAGAMLAWWGPDGSLPLVRGALQPATVGLAALGLLAGLAGRSRRWWATWGAGIGVAAALVVGLLWVYLHATGIVNEHYPPTFLLWVWAALVALGVAVTGWWSGAAAVRAVRIVTAPLALFASFLLVNAHYGYWPTMGALLDRPVAGQVSAATLNRVLTDGALDASGSAGKFGPVRIPGPAGFDAGPAWAWLPPAFDRVDRAKVPVLVMLPGVPGYPYDWEQAGRAVAVADSWARAHDGMAPVMILVSGNGAHDIDTECVNGPHGNAETYLTQSVPDFIVHHLGITPDPDRWGVVGFSEGGTCAIGLDAERPHMYGRFVDISGDIAPNFGPDGATTLKDLYAGNATIMRRHEPLWLLSQRHYPGTEGWFASSAGDPTRERVGVELMHAAAAAGMKVSERNGGFGGHSWTYAARVFQQIYPSLVASMPTPHVPAARQGRRGSLVAQK